MGPAGFCDERKQKKIMKTAERNTGYFPQPQMARTGALTQVFITVRTAARLARAKRFAETVHRRQTLPKHTHGTHSGLSTTGIQPMAAPTARCRTSRWVVDGSRRFIAARGPSGPSPCRLPACVEDDARDLGGHCEASHEERYFGIAAF